VARTADVGAEPARSLATRRFDALPCSVICLKTQKEDLQVATERANDLYAFKSFIDEQLAGEAVPTVDEVLARWDSENETEDERAATVRALKEALADMDADDTGIPMHEVVAELRRKHHLL
jgi:hypothetical protein